MGGDRRVALLRGRARSLLGLLALHAGEVVSSHRLIDQLWGEAPPPTATKALHGLVSTLRKRLQPRDDGQTPPVLETHAPGYLLAIDRDQVDANRFRRLVAEATQAPAATKAARLRDALGLWRGPALDEFAYEPFAQAAIAELEELRLAALEERVEADLALGRHAELVAELEGLIAEHPLRERLRAQLMLALYRCGRQVDALELYRVTRALLVDELGIEPGPALQQLERAILAQDPSLELPQPDDRTLTAEEVVQPGAGHWLAAGRRTVTVLFADLSGSAGAQAVLADPEAVRLVVMQAYKAAVEVLGRHGATVEGFIGDVVVAVFGVPVAHEDDALRAVRAGLALGEHLAAVNAEAERAHGVRLAARIGISTGEVVVGDPTSGTTSTSGPPVALAARLQQAAGDGEVLLGEATRRVVGDAAVLEPATRAVVDRLGGSGIAWRLIAVPHIRASVTADTPYVGRREELERLRGALDRSVQEGRATLVTVIGEAGVGKSRLAREFARSVEPAARVVTGHCPPYGEGITFWPLREILRELTNGSRLEGLSELLTDDPDPSSTAAEVASAVGMVDQPADPSTQFGALRRLFEAVAQRTPLVIIIEDIHWAQPTLLDLLENLAASTHQPLVLLCLARPEFRERRTSWAQELDAAVTVPLEPLDPGDSQRLLTSRRFGRALPPEAVTRVVETAQGNPLFLEQLLAALRDDLELRVPPTVQALLTARLDRLGPAEQDLLRCASVIGLDFTAAAVTALVAHQAIPFVDRHLQALEAKELVTRVRGPTPPATAFRFRHVLIQLAAYGSLTHQDRSELHERFAGWLERQAGERVAELEELIGRHLEQAYVHRRDLGLLDAAGEALALRAGERLASAGLRAYGRFDVPAAENLLSRAKALLPAGHHQRPKVLRRLTEAYPILGRPEEAEAAFAELLDEVGGDDRLTRGIRLEQTRFRLITGPDPISLEVIRQQTQAALEAFRGEGDEVRMSQAHYILSSVHLRAGRVRELEETARRGLVHAHRSGDLRELLGAPWWVVFALLAGPTPVPACLQACEELVDAGGLEHPGVLAAMGHFKAMLGDFQRARELVAHAQHVLRERLRVPRPRIFVGLRRAGVEVLAGNPEAAEHALRPALDVALMAGDREQASQTAAELSLLLSRRGASDEAARAATLAADRAPAESVTAQALAGAARARILLGSGDHREAGRFAREAIKLVPDEMLNLRASLLVGLAEILLAAGRHDEAQPVSAEAVELYERKRNLVAARHAETGLVVPGS
ncbi:MAG TPA: BTAD domain-containing putative transcriptional regulator [Actinomycetes bacterium]|nr:BTAD domain-containing putative transcriptional regulator [Actinomycetes bacterium]